MKLIDFVRNWLKSKGYENAYVRVEKVRINEDGIYRVYHYGEGKPALFICGVLVTYLWDNATENSELTKEQEAELLKRLESWGYFG